MGSHGLWSPIILILQQQIKSGDNKFGNTWKHASCLVDVREYQRRFPHRQTRKGVLEVMGQGLTVEWATGLERHSHMEGFRVIGRPCIVERANASCTYTATENLHEALSASGYERLKDVPLAIHMEIPDDSSANRRKKRKYSRHYHPISWELTENVELTACIDVLKVGKKSDW